ncbi:hypothetical protein FB639_001185 [Coemansia asiatica]|nr:hypothetical protein FB639_001185 [Coemansia asiatica]
MTDLDLDSKAILNGLVYLDQHNLLPPSATSALGGQKQQQQQKPSDAGAKGIDASNASAAGSEAAPNKSSGSQQTTPGYPSVGAPSNAPVLAAEQQQQLLPGMSPKTAAGHFSGAGPHAIATLKVETSAVLKELSRFRACDDQTMSCFYCREWAQWVYRKQISPQAAASSVVGGLGGGSGSGSASGGRSKKKKQQGGNSHVAAPASSVVSGSSGMTEEAVAERERMERKRAARLRFSTIGDLCQGLRSMVASERDWILSSSSSSNSPDAGISVSRPSSPSPSVSSATSSNVAEQSSKQSRGSKAAAAAAAGSDSIKDAAVSATASGNNSSNNNNSQLIDHIVEEVSLWCEGYQFPLADVYEDLTFDFPPDAFPYDDNQDPLDPALLLPALQVTKTFISLPASSFPLLGNITSELIATHTYPTCQHTKVDHPTPSELETQRLIFNSQLQKWRGEYKRSFEREMEPVWQITQLLLKSAQRIEAMRVRLFARGCRANREQFLQTIRNRTQPFAEYWECASEPYRTGKAATMSAPLAPGNNAEDDGDADNVTFVSPSGFTRIKASGKRVRTKRGMNRPGNVKTPVQLAEELDGILFVHLDNLLEVSATWSRTFLESYYGVAREFARELETILGECITMCDRRAQGLKYPPPLTLQPQLEKARSAISCLLPHLESRIARIQEIVRERTAEIFSGTEEIRANWIDGSGTTVQTKLAKAAHKDFRKKLRRIEHQQQTGVIGWAMRELEHLLTAPDVASVVADCLELLMTEAEILERAVGQVFVRKLEPTTEDLREQRQDIIDDFTEGLLTGREELAGIIGKLMLKEAWRILEANISLQRQKALLDTSGSGSGNGGSGSNGKGGGGGSGKKKNKSGQIPPITASIEAASGTTPTSDQAPPLSSAAFDDDDELLNDDAESSVSAKKRKKNKKKKNKKKKSAKQVSPLAMAEASIAEDEYDLDLDDLDDEDDEAVGGRGPDSNAMHDPHNPFASLALADSVEESRRNGSAAVVVSNEPKQAHEERALETPASKPAMTESGLETQAKANVSSRGSSANTVPAAATVTASGGGGTTVTATSATSADAKKPDPPASATQQPPVSANTHVQPSTKAPAAVTSNEAASAATAATSAARSSTAAASRSRRNTNAARYVPGVGFVSDDGTNATSPQLMSSSNVSATGPGYKASVNGISSSGVLRSSVVSSSAAAATGSLGIQTVATRAANSERMSPMVTATRLVSPISRSQSPLVNASTSSMTSNADRRSGPTVASLTTPILDKEALVALEATLLATPVDQLEKKLSSLAFDNLVTITSNALVQRRRIEDYSVKLYDSVAGVVNTYNELQKQVESFKLLFVESNNGEEESRLSALLAQAAQEAQSWHDKCDKLTAEVEALRISNKAKEVGFAAEDGADSDLQKTAESKTEAGPLSLASGLGSDNVWAHSMGFGAGMLSGGNNGGGNTGVNLFGQFTGIMPPHSSIASATATFMANPPFTNSAAASLAHAQQQQPSLLASNSLDAASLMMLAANPQQLGSNQQLAALMGMGISSNAGLSSAIHHYQGPPCGSNAFDVNATVSSPTGDTTDSIAATGNPTSASLLTTLNARSQQP